MARKGLRVLGGVLAAVLMLMTVDAARAADAAALRKNFDDYAARVQAARANKASNNLGGGITWGDSYEMDAYLLMYEATQDADYMDSFVMMADMVNTARADKAGTPDWKGVLHHGWLTDGPYTLGQPVTVLDKDGKPSIEVQAVAQQNNNSATIEIAPDAKKPGEFSIYVYNQATGQQPGHWDGLTPETVEAKVNVPGSPIRVKKLGDTVPIHHNPFTPPTQCCVLLSHQSGRVLAPFAKVAVMVKKYPDMAGLAHRAEMYLTTAEETFAELEAEGGWVDAPDGGGYYKIEKGAPIWCDGVPDTPYALSALGTALLYMNDATGKEIYKTRATQLATFVKGLIKVQGGKAYMDHWYGPVNAGWTAADGLSENTPAYKGLKQPEKIEYMQDTIRFACECARRKIVFTDQDVAALAKTFDALYTANEQGGTLWATLAGPKGGNQGARDADIDGFMLLGGDVTAKCGRIYDKKCTGGSSARELYGWAVLNYMNSQAQKRE